MIVYIVYREEKYTEMIVIIALWDNEEMARTQAKALNITIIKRDMKDIIYKYKSYRVFS